MLAQQQFRAELSAHPDNSAAKSLFAYTMLSEDPRRAVTLAREAVNAQPEQASFQYVLGSALFAAGSPQDALQPLQRAAQLDPENVEFHVELAVAYSKAGRYHDSKREQAVALHMKEEPAS